MRLFATLLCRMTLCSLIAWQKIGQFDADRSFGAWIRGIAANEVKKRYRAAKRGPIILPPNAVEAVLEASYRCEIAPSARRDALMQCLNELTPDQRRLLEMRYECSTTPQQTAA